MRDFKITVVDQTASAQSDTLVITGVYDPSKASMSKLTTIIRERLEGPISEVIGVRGVRVIQKESLI